jgi:BirA family transcriptional regulator, biotin operon repressor / biotin---[acetyl-CoA-carboxylase] ligase
MPNFNPELSTTILQSINQAGVICPKVLYFPKINSTNAYLLNNYESLPNGTVCLADMQTKGKGQKNRPWISPQSANIYGSVLWHFPQNSQSLSTLSLQLGLIVLETLKSFGYENINLKWPNDLIWQAKKLAGILVETKSKGSKISVIAGVGLNTKMPDIQPQLIDQPWTDLKTINPGIEIDRSAIIAQLFQNILLMQQNFQQKTFSPQHWNQYDIAHNKPLVLNERDVTRYGTGRGVDNNGRYLFEINGNIEKLMYGDLKLRLHE